MNTLKIGQHCPVHKGIYAGIARSYNNEPDNHIWLLDAKSPEEYMNWAAATEWAESLGEDTSLPTKNEAALIGCNLAEELGDYGYVWTSTSDGARRAWGQHWDSSSPGSQYSQYSQYSDDKAYTYRVRAVKRLPVTYEMKGHPLAAQALDAQQYADRYRHIRCFGLPMDAFGDCDSYYGVYTSQTGECLDAAIDAAISALQGSA